MLRDVTNRSVPGRAGVAGKRSRASEHLFKTQNRRQRPPTGNLVFTRALRRNTAARFEGVRKLGASTCTASTCVLAGAAASIEFASVKIGILHPCVLAVCEDRRADAVQDDVQQCNASANVGASPQRFTASSAASAAYTELS